MASERRLKYARLISLFASTAISLASGTNYVYSAYAPQLAERLQLSTTESNMIGTCGNIGMYLAGIPAGMLVDKRGPRLSIFLGAIFLFVGYYPIHMAYEAGEGSLGTFGLGFFALLTGVGSCGSFNGAMKAAALNYPTTRGTATALPLAAFGLSAFFFSTLSGWLFPGDTSSFLLVLAIATSAIVFVGFFFVHVFPNSSGYAPITEGSGTRLHRTKSNESTGARGDHVEPGTTPSSSRITSYTGLAGSSSLAEGPSPAPSNAHETVDESSSFLSKSSGDHDEGKDVDEGALVDIRGWALTRKVDFWLLWIMLGLMTGVGLMTINNIGHSVHALWSAFDPSKSSKYVQSRQALHVSILSLLSFTGRIISGTTSDHIKSRHGLQRVWLLVAAASLFIVAQSIALNVENPYNLWMVSSSCGLAYGLLFGVYPTIVSESFGIHGMSQNWGTMTVACVISGQMFNFFYGKIYDAHSTLEPSGARVCEFGLECYRDAYWITLAASILALGLAFVTIDRGRKVARRGEGGRLEE